MVLIPMPGAVSQTAPPSEYALAKRPVLLTFLVLQTVVWLLRICVLFDLITGFFMGIMLYFGWSAWKGDMDTRIWGWMCTINAVFGVAAIITRTITANDPTTDRPWPPLFSENDPAWVMVAAVLFIVSPLVNAFGAYFAWHLYKNLPQDDAIVSAPTDDAIVSAPTEGVAYAPLCNIFCRGMFPILVSQTALTVLCFVINMDILSGVFLAITTATGWAALNIYKQRRDVKMLPAYFWGCFLNGIITWINGCRLDKERTLFLATGTAHNAAKNVVIIAVLVIWSVATNFAVYHWWTKSPSVLRRESLVYSAHRPPPFTPFSGTSERLIDEN